MSILVPSYRTDEVEPPLPAQLVEVVDVIAPVPVHIPDAAQGRGHSPVALAVWDVRRREIRRERDDERTGAAHDVELVPEDPPFAPALAPPRACVYPGV